MPAFDVVIVGGGSAGQAAALAVSQRKRVAVVDDHDSQSPAWEQQAIIQAFVDAVNQGYNLTAAVQAAQIYQTELRQQKPAKRALQAAGVAIIHDWAAVAEPGVVSLQSGSQLPAKQIVVATGSVQLPATLPGAETLSAPADALLSAKPPGRVLVISSDQKLLDLAQALGRTGARVTLIDPNHDSPASLERLQKSWRINLLKSGEPVSLGADLVLLSPQRRPRVDGIAASAELKLAGGGIWVDPGYQTSQRRIYAIGSCLKPNSSDLSSVEQGHQLGQILARRLF